MSDPVKPKRPRGVVTIDAEMCKGCGFCIEFCPAGVLEFSTDFNAKGYHPPSAVKPEACTGCDLCGMYCPDFAIFGTLLKKEEVA
jgi:2-oxoglutarate ferredoxin oxidoreductase subunit delta